MEKMICDCGNEIKEGDVFMNRGTAKCSSCGSTCEIYNEPWFLARRKELKKLAEVPAKILINKETDKLTIKFSWINIFSVLQLGVACLFSIGIFFGSYKAYQDADYVAFLFLLIFVVVILIIFFAQLRFCINKTTITLTADTLKIDSGPLPCANQHFSIATSEISNVFAARYSAGRRGQVTTLEMINNDGEKTTLIASLYSTDEARAIELAIKEFLNLEDEFVVGEFIAPAPFKFMFA
ncbi:MAG: hypothetical protein KKB51_05755 [Candidatus Riflebacteria bacterium]|nr:hypothetical protein [Candidatus Riflebacteria bacterium]